MDYNNIIVRRFDQLSFHPHISSLEGATKLKFAPFCLFEDALFDKGKGASISTPGTHNVIVLYTGNLL